MHVGHVIFPDENIKNNKNKRRKTMRTKGTFYWQDVFDLRQLTPT